MSSDRDIQRRRSRIMTVRVCLTVIAAPVLALATAACGSSGESAETAPASSSVKVQVTAPVDGSSMKADRVTVRGTVTPSDATVQIVGQPAQVGNGVFTGSAPLHRGSNTIDVVASAAGSAPATTTITVTRPGPRPYRGDQVQARRAPPLARATNCGSGLTAGARTSCQFAENVRSEYEQSGSGILEVYSPTTGRTYRMYCTSGATHVCTGGNGALVSFSSGGAPTNYNTIGCGNGLLVGPNTSCGFARNVRAEYSGHGAGWLSVYSPATGRTYNMFCTGSSPHVCTGGNNAAVYFP
jgi:Glucodextranase, domain B